MPPRHVYWTIIVDNQPTAFRAADPNDLLATLNRLKERHPSAAMRWFERGRLWSSREEARQTLRAEDKAPKQSRGKSWRPGGDHRDPREKYQLAKKDKWARLKERWRGRPPARPDREGAPRADERNRPRGERPQTEGGWKPGRRPSGPRQDWKARESRPAGTGWKPKGPGSRPAGGGGWRPKGPGSRPPGEDGWKPKGPGSRPAGAGGWKPKGPGGRPSRGSRPGGGSAWRPKGPGGPPSAGRRPPSRDPRKRGGGGGGR